jgi:hypothetical protein
MYSNLPYFTIKLSLGRVCTKYVPYNNKQMKLSGFYISASTLVNHQSSIKKGRVSAQIVSFSFFEIGGTTAPY